MQLCCYSFCFTQPSPRHDYTLVEGGLVSPAHIDWHTSQSHSSLYLNVGNTSSLSLSIARTSKEAILLDKTAASSVFSYRPL